MEFNREVLQNSGLIRTFITEYALSRSFLYIDPQSNLCNNSLSNSAWTKLLLSE